MDRIQIAELYLDPLSKKQLIEKIDSRISRNEKTFMTTLYSEFLLAAMKDRAVRDLLNRADIAVADGVAVPLADTFLARRFVHHGYTAKIFEAWAQLIGTGLAILLKPGSVYKNIPEKIVGADLIWDIAKLAEERGYSVFLLGGFNDTPELVQKKLLERYPRLNIVGVSNGGPESTTVYESIELCKPDILLVAYGPLKQETFIDGNLGKLPLKFAVGLGGTFDYVAGKKIVPPKFVRYSGLEWLFRLFTQPQRLGRIFNAVIGLAIHLVRYKVFFSMPHRLNACAVVVNGQGRVLVCQRNPKSAIDDGKQSAAVDYWQFPQGGLDEGEDVVTGAARELQEETGIKSIEFMGIAKYINEYVWPNANRPLLWQTRKYKGQKQQTVFFKFTGNDNEIFLDKHELIDYRWCRIGEAVTLVAPERKPHAKAVLKELADKIAVE